MAGKKHMHLLEDLPVPLKLSQRIKKMGGLKKPKTYADLLERHLDSTAVWPDGTVIRTKRFIASTGDLQIHIYPNDHFPPHFHAVSKQRKSDARFHLDILEPISNKPG